MKCLKFTNTFVPVVAIVLFVAFPATAGDHGNSKRHGPGVGHPLPSRRIRGGSDVKLRQAYGAVNSTLRNSRSAVDRFVLVIQKEAGRVRAARIALEECDDSGGNCKLQRLVFSRSLSEAADCMLAACNKYSKSIDEAIDVVRRQVAITVTDKATYRYMQTKAVSDGSETFFTLSGAITQLMEMKHEIEAIRAGTINGEVERQRHSVDRIKALSENLERVSRFYAR